MQNRILIIFLFSIQLLLNGQTIVETNNESTLPYEDINLVTDRDLYLSGESIWFKATVNLSDNQQNPSNIIYIELFNADQKSLVQKKFHINKNIAQGVIDIPSEYLSDVYFLRAYTNYSKNFPVDKFFLSAIQIINPQLGLSEIVRDNNSEPEIYYDIKPKEGLNNDDTQIAFSLSKSDAAINSKAFLYADGKLLKACDVLKNGFGWTQFKAIDSIQYSIAFANTGDDTLVKKLDLKPKSLYSIEQNKSQNNQQIISVYREKENTEKEPLTLELTNNKFEVLSSSKFIFNGEQAQILLSNTKASHSGLYYLILKNKTGEILKAQAYIFNEESKSIPKISINENNLKSRQLLSVQLDKPEDFHYSNMGFKVVLKGTTLPIIDKLKLYFNDVHLLLSYLKTQFNPIELSSFERNIFLQILNNKLNTQEYITLLSPPRSSTLKWIPEVRDVGLSGVVVNKISQKPVKNVPVYLSIFRESPQIHIYESRDDGSFFFSLNNFEVNQDVFICPLFEKIDELELKVNSDFYPIFPQLKAIAPIIDSTNSELLEKMLIASQTSKVYNLSPKYKDHNMSPLPYSFKNPQISIVLDDYIETPTMEMVFKELVPSVRVRKRKDVYKLSIFDSERELYYNDPLVLVDEIPVFNINELMKIAPNVVEKIEVHKSPFILGDNIINGIISIRTFTNNFGGMIMPTSSTFFEYQTLSPSYVFKSINYNSSDNLKSRRADFRTLLYWNPNPDQKNKISFYTSDQKGLYEIVFFGNDDYGQAFNYTKDFEVKD